MRLLPATLWLALMAWVGLTIGAAAQEHHHPTETITDEVGRFYDMWDRIDLPGSSCCSRKDCYVPPVRYIDGHWWFERREDLKWVRVPPEKIETRYDSPDGRAHVCAAPPGALDIVFCFLPAGGA
jgi:hypothetical protein